MKIFITIAILCATLPYFSYGRINSNYILKKTQINNISKDKKSLLSKWLKESEEVKLYEFNLSKDNKVLFAYLKSKDKDFVVSHITKLPCKANIQKFLGFKTLKKEDAVLNVKKIVIEGIEINGVKIKNKIALTRINSRVLLSPIKILYKVQINAKVRYNKNFEPISRLTMSVEIGDLVSNDVYSNEGSIENGWWVIKNKYIQCYDRGWRWKKYPAFKLPLKYVSLKEENERIVNK